MPIHESKELIQKDNTSGTKNFPQGYGGKMQMSFYGQRLKRSTKSGAKELSLSGAQRVQRARPEQKDFYLNQADKVAEYDIENLLDYWESNWMKHSLWKRIYYGMSDIVRRTFPMICVYLLLFYLFMILVQVWICPPLALDTISAEQRKSKECCCTSINSGRNISFEHSNELNEYRICRSLTIQIETVQDNERILNSLLTFFIGFYVSHIVRTWWQNMKKMPCVDQCCISMSAFLSTESCIKQEDAEILVNGNKVDVKHFKKDICRLFLLSWTMCFCRVSTRLKKQYNSPEAFYKKGLLSKKEYQKLQTGNDDGWLERWCTPLLWADKMVWNVKKECKKEECKKDSSKCELSQLKNFEKVIVNPSNGNVEKALLTLQDALDQLSKEYYSPLPGLIHEVIVLALYFFMSVGVIAGQGFHTDTSTFIWKMVLNFPLYFCAKYILLLGWLKLAKDLQNPYGDDM